MCLQWKLSTPHGGARRMCHVDWGRAHGKAPHTFYHSRVSILQCHATASLQVCRPQEFHQKVCCVAKVPVKRVSLSRVTLKKHSRRTNRKVSFKTVLPLRIFQHYQCRSSCSTVVSTRKHHSRHPDQKCDSNSVSTRVQLLVRFQECRPKSAA